MMNYYADFRFYEELNDFLPARQQKRNIRHEFNGNPSIKDRIEALGIPHSEVDLIVVNGVSVGFGYLLQDGDRVAVYPVFESFDISPIVRLRSEPLRKTAFVVDVNLGKLARWLRILGFDVLYRNDYEDAEIVDISVAEHRIILTRDRRLLYAKTVTHGYWVRSVLLEPQLAEVLRRFDLHGQVKAFHRCLECNQPLEAVDKEDVLERLEPKTRLYYDEFFLCKGCDKLYWKGSHFDRIQRLMDGLMSYEL